MAHDTGIGEAADDVILSEERHPGEIEAGEGCAEIVPLAQDRQPREAGLEAFEADFSKRRLSSMTGRPHSSS